MGKREVTVNRYERVKEMVFKTHRMVYSHSKYTQHYMESNRGGAPFLSFTRPWITASAHFKK